MGKRQLGARDLTEVRPGFRSSDLSGKPMVEVAEATLQAGREQISAWRDLEPVVTALIGKVKSCVDDPDYEDSKAADLLIKCSQSLKLLQSVSLGFLRATEGLTKLALLVEGPKTERSDPKRLTEKQLAGIVVETVKKMASETGICPVCVRNVEVQAVNGAAVE